MNGNLVVLNNRRCVEREVGRPLSALASTIIDFEELKKVPELGAIGAIQIPVAVLPRLTIELDGRTESVRIPISIVSTELVAKLYSCIDAAAKIRLGVRNEKEVKMYLNGSMVCIEIQGIEKFSGDVMEALYSAVATFMGCIRGVGDGKLVACFERDYMRSVFVEELCSIMGYRPEDVEECLRLYFTLIESLIRHCFTDTRSSQDID